MKIETKYDIGQEVWFVSPFCEIPLRGIIEKLIISLDVKKNIKESYIIYRNGYMYERMGGMISKVKEELLKSL